MKKLLLIDANSLIHRSFHALPDLTNSSGFPTGALYGFLNMTLKILERECPDFVAAAFDRPEPTFRKKLDESYKAHRPKAPDALVTQIIKARELLTSLQIRSFELPGYEADDIIGTFAKKFKDAAQVRILSGDLDSLQLVEDEKISVITLRKGVTDIVEYDEKAVIERFGVEPERLADWKALVGDASDNIAGVPGIGAKGATKLLMKYSGIEDVLAAENEDVLVKKVQKHKKEALLSKTLALINTNVGLDPDLKDLEWPGFDEKSLSPLLTELEFNNIMKRLKFEKKKEPSSEAPKTLFDSEPKERILNMPDEAAYDWKSIYKRSAINGKVPKRDGVRIFDIMIAAWLLNPDAKDYSLESIEKRFLKTGGNDAKKEFIALHKTLKEMLQKEGLWNIMEHIEMPLIRPLADIELAGIGINAKKLSSLKKNIGSEIKLLSQKICLLAGENFNLNSPKQLSVVLFEKLQIGPEKKKKTKSGALSTREGVLEELRNKHPIIPLIMEYRGNSKILGTYVEPLLEFASKGRVHTTFLQTGTATGRLSSEKPNLQNIPQDSKWATTLRDCFEAKQGCVFVAFDYSQLELRILAHLSGDFALINVFKEGGDVHTATAQKVFGVREVDRVKRRMAKTLNFGVIYGMGARSFARSAGIEQKEAERYIAEYFSEFPMVKKWQDKQKAAAKQQGWLANENGRKRWFGGFKNFSEVERAAINMPTQSLGADIMKLAIIAVHRFLEDSYGSRARIILTVHDELIVEIEDGIVKESTEMIRGIMQSCYLLSVPLIVDVRVGRTLGSMQALL